MAQGAKRLSDWLGAGGLAPLHPLIAQQPPTIVAPPPMAAQREARRAAWSRVAQRAANGHS